MSRGPQYQGASLLAAVGGGEGPEADNRGKSRSRQTSTDLAAGHLEKCVTTKRDREVPLSYPSSAVALVRSRWSMFRILSSFANTSKFHQKTTTDSCHRTYPQEFHSTQAPSRTKKLFLQENAQCSLITSVFYSHATNFLLTFV